MTARPAATPRRPANDQRLAEAKRVLVLQSPYYADITAELGAGARAVLEHNRCTFDTIEVPGALELPQALASAVEAGLVGNGARLYAGVVVLGCVIRGETAHYDIVCNNANHWLMESAIHHRISLGNGVLTVDTHAQALARASGGVNGKGGDAARACLSLIWLNEQFRQQAGVSPQ